MSENTKKPVRRKKRRLLRRIGKLIKWLIIFAALLIAALFGLKAYIQNQAADGEAGETYSRAVVSRGALSDTVYGTGTTSARSQPNVLVQADGTLTELRVSIGDAVKAGDILAVITNETLDSTITDLEFALWELDDQIAGTRAGSKVYAIEAPVAGRVMALYAGVGDDALAVFRREGALALISTDGRMKVELTGDSRLGIALNDTVSITGETVNATGTVTDLTRQGTHATITVIGDGYPMGEAVTVTNAAGETLGMGEMQVNKPMAVSSYGGTIDRVAVKVGDTIKRQSVLYWLEDSPLTLAIESLRLQRETSAKELETAKAQRENLIVIAPCDGVIATVDATVGTEITSGTLLMSILEGEDMNLTIAVDELDVVSVEPGQKVTITVDAFSGAQFAGEVSKIAPVGTNSGGVTTYNVELAFEAEGTGVRSGMNATGEITIEEKADVLYVPVEALMTIRNETYVMIADGGQAGMGAMPVMGDMPAMGDMAAMGGMPAIGERSARRTETAQEPTADDQPLADRIKAYAIAAYTRLSAWLYEGVDMNPQQQVTGSLVKVTVGLKNDDYAEITSGLSEGDVVLYTGEEENNSMFGGFGGGNRGGMNMGGMNMGGMRIGF